MFHKAARKEKHKKAFSGLFSICHVRENNGCISPPLYIFSVTVALPHNSFERWAGEKKSKSANCKV